VPRPATKAAGEPRPSAASGRPTRSPTPAAMDRTSPAAKGRTLKRRGCDVIPMFGVPWLQPLGNCRR
jgi:hypothetical protein